MESKKLLEYEKFFLQYHLDKYNAKYLKVFHNRNSLIPTKVVLYTGLKRRMKYQPVSGEITLSRMFSKLEEDKFYSIPQLIENDY